MNIGERVGDHEIIAILGAGGMGQVYKVRNLLSDRIEAMKVLLPNMVGDPELADRFLREIKVQAALDHPNIARFYTAQHYENQLLMFMEFIDGTSIEKLLREGSLSLDDSLLCASQVLDALSYAHGRGVVHRDIKPGNIMRTAGGIAKLMDFGIARMRADRRLTQTGRTVGSLYYMSPEQINGAEPDPRSDLYSFGVMLYEMVTGRKPFQGDSDYSIMAAHLQHAPAPPVELAPGVPGRLSEIILMGIAKDPQARFQSADAFRRALSNVGQPRTAAAAPPPLPAMTQPGNPPAASVSSPPRPGGRRALYMTLGSVATVAVLAAAIWQAPKFLGVHAGGSAPAAPQSSSTADAPPAPASEPAAAPAPGPAPDAGASAPAPAPLPAASSKTSPPAPSPISKPAPAPGPRGGDQAPVASAQPAENPARAAQPVETAPASQSQPVPAPPSKTPAASAELNDLRKQYNDLSIGAAAAKAGLRSIQQQMRSQGLNLRTDILEAENRMDYLMKEAMDSIRSGNAEEARRDLQMAEISLSAIQKFLGH